ncbi:hypothetical protein BCV70DRAFT_125527 [Testicularia cyperi]|uniref:Up-regulated during septation protein 1 domain-containing protein n=1 Tax=Testicularia cyperi TaxID=1882483 RepID=A0A317XM54_9BASI|nr:hypothetical protein BCV70DRAFT_125527 [Testicularia cyperi]
MDRHRMTSVATSFSHVEEPAWGQTTSSSTSTSGYGADPAFSSVSNFAFPASTTGSGLLPTHPTSMSRLSGRTWHSSNPSMQSSISNTTGWGNAPQSNASDMVLLRAAKTHAPPSSRGGSVLSSTHPASTLGVPSILPSSRDDMLHRLILDQARVDCQSYDVMGLEEVAEAKRELKHVERKLLSLRTKLKVEIKIRDAAIALRKAHRRTISTQSEVTSPTSSLSAPDGSALSGSSPGGRSRALSISASEAKAEQDVTISTAKVDKVTHDLFRVSDRANALRRRILEHQAAALSERVQSLESNRQIVEETMPFLTASSSSDSLAPSASASAVGISKYRDLTTKTSGVDGSDEPYVPRGPDYPLRHNRLESGLSAVSGFSFLDATAPEKVRRLAEELERKREFMKRLEADVASWRDTAEKRQTSLDRLAQELEEARQSAIRRQNDSARLEEDKSRLERDLRFAQQRTRELNQSFDEARARAVREAVGDAERNALVQIKELQHRAEAAERGLSEQREAALIHAKAVQERDEQLKTAEENTAYLKQRAEAAEKDLAEQSQKLQQLEAEAESLQQRSVQAQGHAAQAQALQRDLDNAKAAGEKAAAELAARAIELENLRTDLSNRETQSISERTARLEAEDTVSKLQSQVYSSRSEADASEAKLRELELAVSAERRIMAERDELFHAFERRLESAEQRLQEQDKRCAKMLGKHEGREEMDDLLERIKAGTSGVMRKKKTAGQDIAGLLTSLETHISDLELELIRAANSSMLGLSLTTSADSSLMEIASSPPTKSTDVPSSPVSEPKLMDTNVFLTTVHAEEPRASSASTSTTTATPETAPKATTTLALPTLPQSQPQHQSVHGTTSSRSMRSHLAGKPSLISVNAPPSASTLAPPRSPLLDRLPSPTRSTHSMHTSPSIKYIPPFAPAGFDTRTRSKSGGSTGATAGTAKAKGGANGGDESDSFSLLSNDSPASTTLGLPSSAGSLAGTTLSSISLNTPNHQTQREQSASAAKRTITLGMDVPQLIARIRELEKQLSHSATVRQRAEKANELEMQLREANQAYAQLLQRMESDRSTEVHQKVEMLNELNDAHSRLQTTKAHMQRVLNLSPSPSPSYSLAPLPPLKD